MGRLPAQCTQDPRCRKLGMMVWVYNPGILEEEAGGSEVEGPPHMLGEFNDSLGSKHKNKVET